MNFVTIPDKSQLFSKKNKKIFLLINLNYLLNNDKYSLKLGI